MRFDESLERKHDPRAALRIGGGPSGLRGIGGINGLLELVSGAERHLGLHLPVIGIPNIMLA